MVRINEVIIVEGKYDKITVSQVVDAPIIEVRGFRLFSDKELLALIRKLADERGVILFMDGDGAGQVIRNHLKSAVITGRVLNAYIPDIMGKERRKEKRSSEGKLGVEGMPPEIILESLRRAGATINGESAGKASQSITKATLYEDGFSGKAGSDEKRKRLLKKLRFPERMSTNGMLEALNILYSYDEYKELINGL